jgi:hypothetical protein
MVGFPVNLSSCYCYITNNLSDEETFADKKAWADGYCFGGTMVWSIDFQEQYAMSTPVILSR